jgi:RNA polymerase sigma factor (sigma-70 family)
MDSRSDQEMIEIYKHSEDLEILGQLFHRYTSLVFGVCLKYFKNKEDSKDAVMQIFELLISSLKKHEVRNFKSWLHVSTRNFCLMELRKRSRMETDLSSFSIENMEFSLSEHHSEEDPLNGDIKLLKNCMDELPEKQKTCMQMFYIQEQSYKEVSVNSGFEIKEVKSYIQNGKRNLKNCIEKNRE